MTAAGRLPLGILAGLGRRDEKNPVQARRSPRLHYQGLPVPHLGGAEHGRPLRRLHVQRVGGAPRFRVAPAAPSAAQRSKGETAAAFAVVYTSDRWKNCCHPTTSLLVYAQPRKV